MKRTLIIPAIILYNITISKAQTNAALDINNISANFSSAGTHFCDSSVSTPLLFAPKSNSNINYSVGGLWFGGYDLNGQLYVSAQTYNQSGVNFWPGPLDTLNATISAAASSDWNRVWKVHKSTIDSFKAGLFSSIPQIILDWPAHGDAITYNQYPFLAPFGDMDGDGVYNPSAGDYPLIRGDQAVYFIFNDGLVTSNHVTSGGYLGLEIHAMAYAYNCGGDSAFNNTVFVHYKIINRSTRDYNDFYAGNWVDIDLGNYLDDKVGSDSILNSIYYYDSGADALSVTWLNPTPSTAMAYGNDFSIQGNPSQNQHYYNYLGGLWKDGSPLTYGGTGYGGSSPTNYIYTGNPATGTGWADNTVNTDERIIISVEDQVFHAGATMELDVAFIFGRDYSANQPVPILKQRIQDIRQAFANDTTPCGGSISALHENNVQEIGITIFPHPFSTSTAFEITGSNNKQLTFQLFDYWGREVERIENITSPRFELQRRDLSSGMYFYRIQGEKIQAVGKVIISD